MGTDGVENDLALSLEAEPSEIKFLIPGVYDVLHSPFNIFTWDKAESRLSNRLYC